MKKFSLVLTVFFMALSVSMVLINCDAGNGTTTYTIIFESNGGSTVASISGILSGSTISLPANPTKGTNTFVGWFTDNETFSNEFTASTPVIANITVYAKWISVNTDQKSVKITGFNDEYIGQWQIWLIPNKTISVITDIIAVAQTTPAEGILSGNLLEIVGENPPTNSWTGNGMFYIYLVPRQPNDHLDVNRYMSKQKVLFGQALMEYSFTGNFDIVGDITF
jgi:uncharacterized repeat protein (TIGR02543 family)